MNFKLPNGWKELRPPFLGQRAFMRFNGILVLVTESVLEDDCTWRHVSLSLQTRLPKWKEIGLVKDIFIGKDVKAIQVFPKTDEYVNHHPFCLHLFANMSGDFLPDFSVRLGGVRTI